MSSDSVQQIIDYLWPEGDSMTGPQVYAVLDGARDRRIEPMVRLSRLEHACLYAGRLSPRMQAAAPYVVHLAPDARFTRELLETGWGENWGFFTIVPVDVTLERHRRHFRKLLRVKDESGRILMFRFYDPRVLRVYLPTCTGDEARQFFGPVPRMVAEAEDGGSLLTYTPKATGINAQSHPFESISSPEPVER
ncbi:MAG: DUF4123 domain-containing protein [gamma proteobacterium endosymbiont of Lamellibrachia anaximandri]|nr:DUF4123 domain-containing protein [gamma proteobacterium endosymbiont of Lamellibrachia anaximandri]